MRIAIIGTGFAGLAMGIQLKQHGFEDFVIFEREATVGGTWRDNHYPGAACDVQSHLYSLSFAPNPRWSRQFAPQAEILEYTRGLVETYGLGPHIRCSEGVEYATYVSERGMWEVDTAQDRYTFDLVVSACGGLSRPRIPEFRGLSEFRGDVFHTAQWNHDVDLRGKNVAIIGTGASAIQVIPAIAPLVGQLDVYMRTPSWILPREDSAVPSTTQKLFEKFPKLLEAKRAAIYSRMESRALAFFNPALMKLAQKQLDEFLDASVADPELREKLRPTYLPGCKRILLSDDFIRDATRNVHLITEGVREFYSGGIRDGMGGERQHDVVVMATGFQVSEDVAPFPIVGDSAP
ncbi:MAG: NAD(P)/FAD-dependent oxidoreductase [bacterium]